MDALELAPPSQDLTTAIALVPAVTHELGASDVKVLILLTDFLGWKRGNDWGDLDFFAKYDQKIARIAVVGDRRWETEMMMFLAAGYRKGEVRFFDPQEGTKARVWLASPLTVAKK
jgi:hypothetical protein